MKPLDLLVMGSVMVEITPAREGQRLDEAEMLLPMPSGAATNFALAVRQLGVTVGIISRVGDDEWGQWLCNRLAARAVDVSRVRAVEGQYSPVSFCWMDRQGHKTFYFYRFAGHCDPLSTITPDDVNADEIAVARCFDFTEASIRHQPLRSAAFRAAELARGEGCMVVYAVNYRPAAWTGMESEMLEAQRTACSLADVAVMNVAEAQLLTGRRQPTMAAAEIARLGPDVVALTAGPDGVWLWHDAETTHVPAFKVRVLYDIGAGDAFHAGIVAGLLRGLDPVAAARMAAAVAALKISRPPRADHLPTWDEAARLAGIDVSRDSAPKP